MVLRRILLNGLFFVFLLGATCTTVLAVDDDQFTKDPCGGKPCFEVPDPSQIDPAINTEKTFREQVISIVNYFLSFVGLVAVIAIIYGGILWIFSGGEEENVTKGRKIVLWAGAGIILILLSFTIVRFFIDAGRGVGTGTPGNTSGNRNPDGSITLPDGTVVSDRVATIITGGPNSGAAPLTVELSGIQSRYPIVDQTIPESAYHWNFTDLTGKLIDLGTGNTITHTFSESGRYVINLKIDPPSGSTLKEGTQTFAVEVFPQGADVKFTINARDAKMFQQFSFTEASRGITFVPMVQPVGNRPIQTYSWNFGDGTPIVQTASPEAITHIYTRNGTYTVTLTATDTLGATRSKQATVAVLDVVARMNITPVEKFAGDQLTFSASDSASSFGDILETNWIVIDGDGKKEESTERIFTRTFQKSGNIQVTLTVKDTSGKIGAVSEVVRIRSHAPKANFSFKEKNASQPATIVFDAGTSSDIDSDPLLYSWDFENDGDYEVEESSSARTEFTFPEKGAYNVKLRITDPGEESDEIIQRVEISSALNVDFTADRFVAHPGEEITFSAESENAITYFWDFGDEATTQGEDGTVRHLFREKGKYEVTLTVFDRDDQENRVTRTVFIGERDMPVAVFDIKRENFSLLPKKDLCGSGRNGVELSRADFVSFDASSSINRDGQESNLEYEWMFHDGVVSREQISRRRFDDLPNEDGSCFPVKLTVRDASTGKRDTAETIWIKIVNAVPQMDSLVVSLPENRIAPVVVPLRVQNPRDPDGTIAEYKWWAYREGSTEKIGLHTTVTPATSIILPVFGNEGEVNRYYFVVEIKDNLGAKMNSEGPFGKSAFVEARNGENRSPIVDFRMEKTSINEGDTITFFAEAVDPMGGTIPDSGYMWDFNGDNVFDALGTGPQVTYRFESPGEFEVRLKVVHRGLSSSKSRKVFVALKHKLPKAAFTYSIQGHNVLFNAANSAVDTTIPGNTVSYAWDLDTAADSDGDGNADNDIDSTEERVRNFYEDFGNHSVRLTVTDRLGVTDTVTRTVPVRESGRVIGEDGTERPDDDGKGIKESVRLRASHPLTSLDLVLERGAIALGEKTVLLVFVKNANNTLFEGQVEFRITSGSAALSAPSAKAVRGEARVEITGNTAGKVVVEATAKDTVSGDVSEEITFTVE